MFQLDFVKLRKLIEERLFRRLLQTHVERSDNFVAAFEQGFIFEGLVTQRAHFHLAHEVGRQELIGLTHLAVFFFQLFRALLRRQDVAANRRCARLVILRLRNETMLEHSI